MLVVWLQHCSTAVAIVSAAQLNGWGWWDAAEQLLINPDNDAIVSSASPSATATLSLCSQAVIFSFRCCTSLWNLKEGFQLRILFEPKIEISTGEWMGELSWPNFKFVGKINYRKVWAELNFEDGTTYIFVAFLPQTWTFIIGSFYSTQLKW